MPAAASARSARRPRPRTRRSAGGSRRPRRAPWASDATASALAQYRNSVATPAPPSAWCSASTAKPCEAWMLSGGATVLARTRSISTCSSDASESSSGESRAAMRRSAQTSLSASGLSDDPLPRAMWSNGVPSSASPWRISCQACRYDRSSAAQALSRLPCSATAASNATVRSGIARSSVRPMVHCGRMLTRLMACFSYAVDSLYSGVRAAYCAMVPASLY